MKAKNWFLSALLISSIAVSAIKGDTQPVLKDAFAGDFLIGTALNRDHIFGNLPKETVLVAKQFNSITPENVLKWEKIHPEPDRYDFAPADRFVEFGEKHNMFIVGHVLVWHNQTPRWVFEDAKGMLVDRDTLLSRMKNHIHTVVGRYKGRIHGWDVVNEAVDGDGSLRKTKWLEIIGEDYIAKAFEYARQADPKAELYYNDFDMWHEDHREGAIRLVKKLQAKGIHIDGMGMQLHSGLNYPPYDQMGFYYPRMDLLEDSIIAYARLGVKVMVTELDVTTLPKADPYTGADITRLQERKENLNPYVDGLPARMQYRHAACYADLFSVFHKHADKISRVTFWGVQDGNSWCNNWPMRGRTDYPLLFDRDCKPKLPFHAVIEVAECGK